MLSLLKITHGLGHGYANLIVHHANKTSASATVGDTDLIADQYIGKENLKPWYDRLMKEIHALGSDIELASQKSLFKPEAKKAVCHYKTFH